MKLHLRSAALSLALSACAFAADVTGTWKAKFDTQVGEQSYTYELKADGDKLTGKAISANGSSDLSEGSIKGDDISFVETLNFQGMQIRVEYKGKVSGDEIKFTRQVGEFATEQLVAKREK